MTLYQWFQTIAPVVGALLLNFFELRKIRHEMAADRRVADERHKLVQERLGVHDTRLARLEAK
jgi:hypothetical protein